MNIAAIERRRHRQEELGQFLTPSPVASFMASMFYGLPKTVRLLDAGAGAGALTAVFVFRLCEKHDGVRAIETTFYDLDPEILDSLSATMRECQRRCTEVGIRFTFIIHSADFLQEMSGRLARDLFSTRLPVFDTAIVNLPYRDRSTLLPKLLSGEFSVTELQY